MTYRTLETVPSCSTCVFYCGERGKIVAHIGTCRRYPPQITRLWDTQNPKAKNAGVLEEYSWPMVGRKDWCGEHRDLEELEEMADSEYEA